MFWLPHKIILLRSLGSDLVPLLVLQGKDSFLSFPIILVDPLSDLVHTITPVSSLPKRCYQQQAAQ
jgi:hypothetical protein